jgi:isoleucyl-tRNA synthetase
MTDTPAPARDYRDTVFLPTTDFPMKAGLPQKEPAILAKWQADGAYSQLRAARAGRTKFILHDGPPYANGDMHIGHALNHILKDMVCRTQNLLGRDAPYVPGWDCHGLPIEWKVEELYRKKKQDKDQVPVEEFRAECRAYAANWVNVQREQLKRLGIMGDWDNPYLTMDAEAEATIVSELLKFAETGQLYRGAKPVMWSPVEKTALAEAEVEYEDITSTQIDVAFEIVESPIPELVGAHAVIWTTTPWTIPVNQAIAYGPDVEYAHLEYEWYTTGRKLRVLIAAQLQQEFEKRLDHNPQWAFPERTALKAIVKGSDLAGTIARHPIYNYLRHSREGGEPSPDGAASTDHAMAPRLRGGDDMGDAEWERALEFFARPRPFLPGTFVTTDAGTGLVHMAPDHGEDDFDLCVKSEAGRAHGLNPVFAVEGDGKYRADWAWLGGQGSVINPKFNAPDGPICTALREAGGLLAASADFQHSYPHSWRSKAKLIYRCTPQWFVPMDKPVASEPHKTARAEPVEAPALTIGNADDGASSGRTQVGHGSGIPATLRDLALAAIADTRWVPAKGENRIRAMIDGRPDWVLSRQRAWGVPITLFVHRTSGDILVDADVNARIVAAVRASGVDAWSEARAQDYLGSHYDAADYERVTDILDVWFDSGCTHAFVLESGKWPDLTRPAHHAGPWADLYLEGSDQHRGWFQSSLLESCATRGHAPYKAVLTHGFTMASDGRKMSKSLGNTIDPIKVMETSGADIIRLWALSVDFTEDHRIGDEILKGTADQYRKLRNTFRYMLGALDGFGEDEQVAVADMPELERYMLHRLAALDTALKQAVEDFDFNTYVRALTDFMADDLSAFYFDIRKDSLYCDIGPAAPLGTDKRRAYRTVLDTLFHALIRYAAPVLVFTAEEVWGTRFPDAGSVHLLEWPVLTLRHPREGGDPSPKGAAPTDPEMDWPGPPAAPRLRGNDELEGRWSIVRDVRRAVTEAVEPLRRAKEIGSSLQAEIQLAILSEPKDRLEGLDLSELFITAGVTFIEQTEATFAASARLTTHHKCGRCWRHLPEVTDDGSLCNRCATVLGE